MGLGVPHSQHFENVPDVQCLKPREKRRESPKRLAARSISRRLHAEAPDLGAPPHRSRIGCPEMKSNLTPISMLELNIRTHSEDSVCLGSTRLQAP
jgi:hypothetical protein